MKDRLKEHGMKHTPQRLELSKILKEIGGRHPSFNEIYEAIKARQPSISRSTVHNNLKTMTELGLIESFNYKGETHYEMDTKLHVNLAMPKGEIRDVKNEKIKNYLKEIAKVIDEEEGVHIKNLLIIAE